MLKLKIEESFIQAKKKKKKLKETFYQESGRKGNVIRDLKSRRFF